MKKLTVIVLALAMVILPSCKNQGNKAAENGETPDLSTKEAIINEEVKAEMNALLESIKQMKGVPFAAKDKNGKIILTEKEKKVKPDYLLDPAAVNNAVTLQQKYRLGGILAVDLLLSNAYEMPGTELKEALAKLLVDVDDEAFTIFASTPWVDENGNYDETQTALSDLAEAEFEAGRANFFWETTAASLVEQVYILTRNIDLFLQMFDDQTAADVTFNFVCLHEGMTKMIEFYPEMSSLNEVLEPLYVINAMDKAQLKDQLTELKDSIETARAALLK